MTELDDFAELRLLMLWHGWCRRCPVRAMAVAA